MAKKPKSKPQEADSAYFLKLVLYLILGSQWLRITDGESFQLPIPVGIIIGIFFVTHEHFQIDRKIEFAVLLIAMFVSFWLPVGINLVV